MLENYRLLNDRIWSILSIGYRKADCIAIGRRAIIAALRSSTNGGEGDIHRSDADED
jgi:hypothetical protein